MCLGAGHTRLPLSWTRMLVTTFRTMNFFITMDQTSSSICKRGATWKIEIRVINWKSANRKFLRICRILNMHPQCRCRGCLRTTSQSQIQMEATPTFDWSKTRKDVNMKLSFTRVTRIKIKIRVPRPQPCRRMRSKRNNPRQQTGSKVGAIPRDQNLPNLDPKVRFLPEEVRALGAAAWLCRWCRRLRRQSRIQMLLHYQHPDPKRHKQTSKKTLQQPRKRNRRWTLKKLSSGNNITKRRNSHA
mmetsp:Transcript_22234/g.41695  ORF Transcript_22234/g.41695 Transcript_22234/m.41695 type:complete len:244 (+) Transcript_22234:955-1686(+)